MYVDPNRAAQYVRMSTDMQTYSIENQSIAIAGFALARGFDIVRTYVDSGKSGLTIDRRTALLDLLGDVRSGRADFSHLLIYDVSRWGRFQDPDESAHYEFICRQAGIAVHYCAEQFENSGSLIASVIKNIKRAMAAEFSRELSVKVHAGHARLVSRGFYIGSVPGYGLRRFLVGENGNPTRELVAGQRKSVRSERVTLVPGPKEEIQTIQRVYDLYLNRSETINNIARILNADGLCNSAGRPWRPPAVRELLTNEKYVGNLLYNRTSAKLRGRRTRNPPNEWVRSNGAFQQIVPVDDFRRAQALLRQNALPYTDNDLLDSLTAIWCSKGKLKVEILESVRGAPTATTYFARFGSLFNAYRMIGYKEPFTDNRARNYNVRKFVASQIIEGVQRAGGSVETIRGVFQLRINGDFKLSVVVGRSRRNSERRALAVSYLSVNRPDILLVVRVDRQEIIKDYFAIPALFLPKRRWLSVSGRAYEDFRDFRLSALEPFYELCRRTRDGLAS